MKLFGSRAVPGSPVVANAVTTVPLGLLLSCQWRDGVFERYDLIVRYLVAQELLASNDSPSPAKEIYRSMQAKRAGIDSLAEFEDLARSVAEQGLLDSFPVGVSPSGQLLDGAHRVAVALAVGADSIAVDVREARKLRPYGLKWFRGNDFPEDALVPLEKELDALMGLLGADTLVIADHQPDCPLSEVLRSVMPETVELISDSTLSLTSEQVATVENALSHMPWHEKDRPRNPEPLLSSRIIDVVTLRDYRSRWTKIPKSSIAIRHSMERLARRLEQDNHAVRPVIGLTMLQNRSTARMLASLGWKPERAI